MKKIVTILFGIALLLFVAVWAYYSYRHPSDAQLQRRAIGLWDNSTSSDKLAFHSDGSWLIQEPSQITNRINTWSGIWQIEDGVIVMTMTNIDVGRYAKIYEIPRLKILQIDKGKLVYQSQRDDRVFTFLKSQKALP